MQSRAVKFILSVVLAGAMSLCLAACGQKSDALLPDNSANAAVGQSPQTSHLYYSREYELYKEVKNSGDFTGSFYEFLVQLGIPVSDDTPYVNAAMTSVVGIQAEFPQTSSSGGARNFGSGVIYSLDKSKGDAYVITNYHVLYSASRKTVSRNISLFLYGSYSSGAVSESRVISATFCGGEMDMDIAVLKVTESEVLKQSGGAASAVEINPQTVTTGERVYALGNPNGEGLSVTGGVVSMPYETIEVLRADDAVKITLPEIRFDAAVNHGNSGGGLYNAKGELVGIVNARSDSEAFVGYAIPMSVVLPLVQRILSA